MAVIGNSVTFNYQLIWTSMWGMPIWNTYIELIIKKKCQIIICNNSYISPVCLELLAFIWTSQSICSFTGNQDWFYLSYYLRGSAVLGSQEMTSEHLFIHWEPRLVLSIVLPAWLNCFSIGWITCRFQFKILSSFIWKTLLWRMFLTVYKHWIYFF